MFSLSVCVFKSHRKRRKRERERSVGEILGRREKLRRMINNTGSIDRSIDRSIERSRATFHATRAMMMFCANNSKTDGAPGALLLLIHHKNKKSKKRVNFARGRETRKARSLSLSSSSSSSDQIASSFLASQQKRSAKTKTNACLPFRTC
jgi:hypothetical protein